MAIVQRINSRIPQVSLLALDLLDHLVKNVGYPFHLQIATKEFLNELVKRFPERPPMFPSPTQTKILTLVHEWKNTICIDSKRKEDLVHIRDMHRLLTYKGYRFPDLDARVKGVLNPENNLQSPEELEEEDRAAQSAKLQELIRRGTPRDLEQAQELMKIMSGAEPENKPDYASQTAKELDKVQSRAILLNDMLDNYQEGEKFVRGDGYDQIASHLRSIQPRLQKWISQEEDNESDQMDRLLLLNDLVNQVCERYQSFRKGDLSAKAHIDPSIDPAKGGSSAVPTAKISDLISFDDESAGTSAAAAPSSSGATSNFNDDFAGLTFGDDASSKPSSGLTPNLFDPTKLSKPPAQQQQQQQQQTFDPFAAFSSPSTTSKQPPAQVQRSGSELGGWGALQLPTGSGSGASTPLGAGSSSMNGGKSKAKDPFEDLLA